MYFCIISLNFTFILAGLRQRTIGPPVVKGRLSSGHQEMSSTPLAPNSMGRVGIQGQTPRVPMRAITGNKTFLTIGKLFSNFIMIFNGVSFKSSSIEVLQIVLNIILMC